MDQLASLILILLFSGLFISLIKGGWTGRDGAQTWFKAKFLGQVPA